MRQEVAKRLRGLRYAIGDIVYVTGRGARRVVRALARLPRAAGRGVARFWSSLSVVARRRLVAALGAGAVVILLVALVIPNLPCSFPGGDSCPAPDDAAELVPADALAYAHADVDPDSDDFARASDLAEGLPVLGRQVVKRAKDLLAGAIPTAGEFDSAIEPWLGGEAAVALLPGDPDPERVDLLEVSDREGADAFAASLASGEPTTQDLDGVQLSVDRTGLATAVIDGFLAVGPEAAVRAVIETAAADGGAALADDSAAERARDELPEHRLAEVWLSPQGVDSVISSSSGVLSTLSPLVSPGSTEGVAASLSAEDDGFQLAIRSVLDPERESASPGFFAAFPAFAPDLAGRLPEDTLAYLGTGAPSTAVAALLSQAADEAPGIARGFARLTRSLARRGGVDLQSGLLGSLGDQAAFTLEPGAAAGDAVAAAGPYLMLVADGVDEDAARAALAAVQAPIAGGADASGSVQAPGFSQRDVDGVSVSSFPVSSTVQLTYAVFDGLLTLATDPAGVGAMIAGDGGLDQADAYRRATEGFPERVSLLAYLDLAGLVVTGERAGLAEDPLYATFAGDLRRLRSLGMAVSDTEDVLRTDLRLLIAPAQSPETGDSSQDAAGTGD